MTTPKVYVICDQNCKFEGMTKEQILTAILQAVNEGTIGDIDAGFITTIKTINGPSVRFFYGEQAAYDELTPEEKEGLYPIITNDTTKEDTAKAIKDLQNKYDNITSLKLTYNSSKNDFISIYDTGIYVIDIDDISNSNIHHTCVIMISDFTKKVYSTLSRKMPVESESGTHFCQIVMHPQAAEGSGNRYGVLQVEHNSAYDWVYKISKITRIGG